jgi:hypothetical protein
MLTGQQLHVLETFVDCLGDKCVLGCARNDVERIHGWGSLCAKCNKSGISYQCIICKALFCEPCYKSKRCEKKQCGGSGTQPKKK